MQNPLLLNTTITAIDTMSNEEVVVSRLTIGKYYKKVYCLCPFTTIDHSIITMPIIPEELYNMNMSKMILYETKINIVKNMVHYGNLIYCNRDHVKLANHFNYDLDEMSLVLPFFNISFMNLIPYINTIMGDNNLDKLYNMHVMYNYFGEKNKDTNVMALTSIIRTLTESNYWKYEYNCRCNLTKLFDKRNFNFSTIKASTDAHVNVVIQTLTTVDIKENYLEEIFKSKNYTDPSSVICKKGYRLYNTVKNCKYNNTDIISLFNSITCESQRSLLFIQLMVSKEYSHLAINNYTILQMMLPHIIENIILYEYIIGYSWLRFYFEECISKFNMKTSDYYIFDAETASILPVFYFDYNSPQKNPYMPILVANHSLNPSYNIGGVAYGNKFKDHRICNTSEFIDRMNIFISNDKDKNIFYGIDFKENKIGVTGSIMTACLQYYHPLLELYETKDITMNSLYNRFFNEYYCNADIDIMIKTYNMIEFIDICKNIHKQITKNVLNTYDYSEPHHVNIKINQTVYLFVTSDFIKKVITNIKFQENDDVILDDERMYELIVSNLGNNKIIKMFEKYIRDLYEVEVNKIQEGLLTSEKEKYREYFELDMKNVVIKLYNKRVNSTVFTKSMSEYSEEEIDKILETSIEENDIVDHPKMKMEDGVSISISFKTRICAPQLDHDMELFPIKKDDFMSTVGQFHMPCVRAYYDGSKVYMTPSCITAHMTYMNIDYKYFAGSKDPVEIINKYRMRGFGTWLNKNEITTFIKYSASVPFWNNLYNINLKNKNMGECLGSLNINNKLFFPRQYNMEYYDNPKLRPIPFDDPYIIPPMLNPPNRY